MDRMPRRRPLSASDVLKPESAFIIQMPHLHLHRPLLLALIAMIVVLCAFTASTLIGWSPASKGLPADISAIQEPNRKPLAPPSSLPRKIKPEDLRLD